MISKIEDKLRSSFSEQLSLLETILYLSTGFLLGAAALSGVIAAGASVWHQIAERSIADNGFTVLDQLLLVLMLVEILHTVRISIRAKALVVVPFLIGGLAAAYSALVAARFYDLLRGTAALPPAYAAPGGPPPSA